MIMFQFIRAHLHSPRLQNSPYFCVFKYARAVKQKVLACEARALRARKTLTPCFTDFFTDFEKKNRLFCSLLFPESRRFAFINIFMNYGQFALSYIFSNLITLIADTFYSSLSVRIYLTGFDCTYLLQVQGNGMNERHSVTSSELPVGTSESNRASEQLSATVTESQVGQKCEQRSAGRVFALTSFHPEANDLTRAVTSNQESGAVKAIENRSVIKGIRDSQALITGNQAAMETSNRTGTVMNGSIQEINQETRAVRESETFRRNQFETGVCHQNSNSENYLQPVDSENLQVRAQTSRFTCDRKAHTFQSRPRPKPRLKIMGKSVTESFQHKDSSLTLPPLNTRCTDTRTRMAERSNCTSPRTIAFHGATGYQNDQCLKSFYQNTVGKTGSTMKPHSKVESPYTPVFSNTNWEVSCNHLTLFERIGGGSFGQVWKGAAWEVNGAKSWSVVAVKMLKGEVIPPSLIYTF